MPVSKVMKKKKTKKLSNADILKLIKKLKPKNQNTVRIQIGDKTTGATGAKSGSVPAYAPSPYVSFVHTNPPSAPPHLPSAPLPPAPLPPAPVFNFQPRRITTPPAVIRATDRPATRLSYAPTQSEKFKQPALELERDIEREELRKVTKKLALQKLESTVYTQAKQLASNPMLMTEYENRMKFEAPRRFQPSTLGGSSSQPFMSDYPTQNDIYESSRIQTVGGTDQIGVRSNFNMSSDTWTLSPSGDVPESALPVPDVSTSQFIEEQALPASTEAPPVEFVDYGSYKPAAEPLPSITLTPSERVIQINKLIMAGRFDISEYNIPPSYLTTSGRLKANITNRYLNPIWTDLQNI